MDSQKLERLPEKGVYTLIINVTKKKEIEIGALGSKSFVKGYYAYTGSALGNSSTSMRNRVLRHLQEGDKKRRWHIDFLLADKNVQVETVIAVSTKQKKECQVNRQIKTHLGAKILVPRFGASDCKQKCVSHLLYLGEENRKVAIKESYEEVIGKAVVIDF